MATATKQRATKKAPAKKAPAKKAAAKKPTTAETGRKRVNRGTTDQQKQVVQLRNKDGLKWNEIADHMGMTSGRAMYIYLCATEEPFPAKTEKGMRTAIVKGRDGGMSWGLLSVKALMSENAVRNIYKEEAGIETTKGLRIGKGGRYPGDVNPNGDGKPVKKAASKKAAAKKAPAKKRATKKRAAKKKALADLTFEELSDKLTGKKIKTVDGDVFEVAEVAELNNGVVVIVDDAGEPTDVQVTQIASATV